MVLVKKRIVKKHLFVYSMLLIPILHFAVFYVYVNFSSIMLAFRDQRTGSFTIGNFTMFFRDIGRGADSEILAGFKNTVIYYASGLFVQLPLTFLFSYFLFKKIFGSKFFKVIFILPMIISPVVLTAIFKNLLSIDGPVQTLYTAITGKAAPFFLYEEKYAKWMIVIYTLWTGFGLNMIVFSGAMARVPDSVLESAKIDGAGFYSEMMRIVLPMIWPTFATLLLLQSVQIFSASGPILLFTRGYYDTSTISYWLYEKVILNGIYNYAAAYGIIFTLFSLPLFFLTRFLTKRVPDDLEY